MSKPRVLIADDHTVMRAGIVASLENQYDIAGTYQDGCSLAAAATQLRPAAIVLDISLPLMNGIDTASLIRATLPETKILFFTTHTNPAHMAAALHAGGNGYLLKNASPEELRFALGQVLSGETYIATSMVAGTDTQRNVAPSILTGREREVLQLIAQGRAAKEIAYQLMISVRTVSFHRDKIKQKLGLSTTAGLTKYALEAGMLDVGPISATRNLKVFAAGS